MTAAEQLEAIGMEKGIEKGREQKAKEVTVYMLQEKVDPKLIAKVTEIDLATVLRIKAAIDLL